MLFVDGGNDKIGVGTNAPARQFTLQNTIANAGGELGLLSSDSNTSGTFGTIHFGNNTDTSLASIRAVADGSTTSGKLQFNTEPNGGAIETRMTIDSAGNVGIATSSPATFGKLSLAVDGTTTPTTANNVKGSSVNLFAETNGGSANSTVGIFGWQSNTPGIGSGIGFSRENGSNWGSQIRFYTHPTTTSNISNVTERMRIESSGNVLVGTTSYSAGGNGTMIESAGQMFLSRATTGQAGQLVFQNPNGSVGQVVTSGTSTAYNTSSDYRLKENVVTEWDATSRLKQLKPSRFNFIADADTTVDGFLAHEVSSVVPEAISGTKDAIEVWEDGEELPDSVSIGDNKLDADGNTIPVMQGIDQSKIVPLLVKTIQELEARITALEGA